ncbi:MAG TPA: DUF4411 family protein [Methylophilaceae bacterium]|nr:DUF4411 family protein [Methylophilaceae bacterium]
MHVIDASSIVYAWDNYPKAKLTKLWVWLESMITEGELVIPSVALDEVSHVAPECHAWLIQSGITVVSIGGQVLQKAQQIKAELGIVEDRYDAKGVDENDLIIIACASELHAPLVSNEAVQSSLPSNKAKYKIPAVCTHVLRHPCVDFLAYFSSTEEVF